MTLDDARALRTAHNRKLPDDSNVRAVVITDYAGTDGYAVYVEHTETGALIRRIG